MEHTNVCMCILSLRWNFTVNIHFMNRRIWTRPSIFIHEQSAKQKQKNTGGQRRCGHGKKKQKKQQHTDMKGNGMYQWNVTPSGWWSTKTWCQGHGQGDKTRTYVSLWPGCALHFQCVEINIIITSLKERGMCGFNSTMSTAFIQTLTRQPLP